MGEEAFLPKSDFERWVDGEYRRDQERQDEQLMTHHESIQGFILAGAKAQGAAEALERMVHSLWFRASVVAVFVVPTAIAAVGHFWK